jgi:hypothetical protein
MSLKVNIFYLEHLFCAVRTNWGSSRLVVTCYHFYFKKAGWFYSKAPEFVAIPNLSCTTATSTAAAETAASSETAATATI